jgi:hypothetical protein
LVCRTLDALLPTGRLVAVWESARCHKDKQQQKVVLKDHDNKQKFMEYLDQRINDSINRYFGFYNCDENVSDDDDTGFISD